MPAAHDAADIPAVHLRHHVLQFHLAAVGREREVHSVNAELVDNRPTALAHRVGLNDADARQFGTAGIYLNSILLTTRQRQQPIGRLSQQGHRQQTTEQQTSSYQYGHWSLRLSG